jgi:SulP family sulfate permease
MLAAATAGIMVMGPVIIGYIPVMVVGALIFLLGIELLEEALVDTWGKLSRLEYLTVCSAHLLTLELQSTDWYRW